MSDPEKIISVVMNDEKLLNSKSFKNRVYKDEPILKTAARLCKPKTPERIEKMKKIAFSPEAYWKTSAWLFYTQGKFMEDYEDNYDYNADFSGFYTTYRDLTAEQLRGYFSWRTKVRNGIVTQTSLPYVYLYSYELLNGIGTASASDGFDKLRDFGMQYKQYSPEISSLIESWLVDYAAYHQLSTDILSENGIINHDRMLSALKQWENSCDDDIFEALCTLSAYDLEASAYYSQYPIEFRRTSVNSFKKLSEYFMKNRKKSLFVNYFGNPKMRKYHLFESAVFYDRDPLKNLCYKINEVRTLTCRNGAWSCESYLYINENKYIKAFLKAVDNILQNGSSNVEQADIEDVSKTAFSFICQEADKVIVSNRKIKQKKIEIDISKLEDIRKASAITRDKLLVEEENETEEITETNIPEPHAPDRIPLNDSEYEFLKALIYGGNWKNAANLSGVMPSILADSVNEKLFDLFSDTVINFSGDAPELIEDYTDELKGMIRP